MKKVTCLLLCCSLLMTVLVPLEVAGLGHHTRAPQKKKRLKGPTYYCTTHPSPSVEPDALKQALQYAFQEAEQKIQAALDQDKSPGGVAVGFVYRDTLIWSKGFGLIDMKDPSRGPPTQSTGFRIGSITKVLTALMTLILRDKGSLHSLDDNVSEYLPEFKIKNPFQTGCGITFRQLMSHMSGLPRTTPCEDLFVKGCTLSDEEIYKNLADIELLYPPGEQPVYSNLGFGLLGRSLEKITKSKWEESVQEMVLGPLGMVNTANTYTEKDIAKLAVGYYKDGSKAEFISMGWDAPAGQAYSTVADLSKLMMLVFRDNQSVNTGDQILDGETIREWLEAVYVYADTTGFSYPWEILSAGNYSLRTKDGRINGYMSEIQMATDIKTGFVILQSCDNCLSHYDIIGKMQEVILQTDTQLLRLQPPPKAPNKISEYVGVYSAMVDGAKDTWYINATTIYGGPILTAEENGAQIYLQWDHDDSFQASLEGAPGPVSCYSLHDGHIGQRVYFQREEGAVVSFTLPGTVYGKVYKKTS